MKPNEATSTQADVDYLADAIPQTLAELPGVLPEDDLQVEQAYKVSKPTRRVIRAKITG